MPYKDPEKQREYQRKWIAKRREEWIAENGPCARCGSSVDLQVDHKNPRLKITHRIWSWSKKRRDEELAKCWVLCRSCHLTKALAKGEVPSGEQHSRAKLTEAAVLEARERYAAGGVTLRQLASEHGVYSSTMYYAVSGKKWKIQRIDGM